MDPFSIPAHFDGRQILLDEPCELEPDAKLLVGARIRYRTPSDSEGMLKSICFRFYEVEWLHPVAIAPGSVSSLERGVLTDFLCKASWSSRCFRKAWTSRLSDSS